MLCDTFGNGATVRCNTAAHNPDTASSYKLSLNDSLNDTDSTATASISDTDDDEDGSILNFRGRTDAPTPSRSSASNHSAGVRKLWPREGESGKYSWQPSRFCFFTTVGKNRMFNPSENLGKKQKFRKQNEKPLFFILCCVMALALVFMVESIVISRSPWNLLTNGNDMPKSVTEGNSPPSFKEPKETILSSIALKDENDYYTIRVITELNRVDLVQKSVDSHAMCSHVTQIQVDWRVRGVDPPTSIAQHTSGKVMVIRSEPEVLSGISPTVKTDGVLLLQDDLIFTCEDLDRAFLIWKQDPERMVGFYAFRHKISNPAAKKWWFRKKTLSGSLPKSPPGQPPRFDLEEVGAGSGQYSIVADRAAFLHRIYLKTSIPSGICKNFAMSIKITSICGKPPILVSGNPTELRSSETMIRWKKKQNEDLLEKSDECLSTLMSMFQIDELPYEYLSYTGLPV